MSGVTVAEAVRELGALQRRTLDLFIERRHLREEGQPTRLQGHVLRAICEKRAMEVSAIARLLEVSPATTSQLLTTMEEKGWLERTLVPNDRRRHRVVLTPAGEAVVRDLETRRTERITAVLAALSAEERAHLVALARRVVDLLGQLQTDAPGERV